MVSEVHTQKHGKRKFNNPFPREPANIGFLKGEMFFGEKEKALSTQSFPAGNGFELKWHAEKGGFLSVYHRDELNRILWSTAPGVAFICGALGKDRVEESRGSFSVHDKAELVCNHQTIEHIEVVWPQSRNPVGHDQSIGTFNSKVQIKANMFFQEACTPRQQDGDGHKLVAEGPAVIITGCLYSDPMTAASQLNHFLGTPHQELGPFYDHREACFGRRNIIQVGVRYWLFFCEKRNHHFSFSLKLDHPVLRQPSYCANVITPIKDDCLGLDRVKFPTLFENHARTSHRHLRWKAIVKDPRLDCALDYLDQVLWLWSEEPLSAFKDIVPNRISKFLQPVATLNRLRVNDMFVLRATLAGLPKSACRTDFLVDESIEESVSTIQRRLQKIPKLNRVVLTYTAEDDERFFGFGEQFSYFDFKGRRVPIMVQEQGLGRGDQPITAAVNLIAERSGGDWHTTYAPSPYYITSKSRCLFLENYSYSVFDLRIRNRVQVQLHGDAMQGRILHGRSPLQLIERYTEAIGRMRELPAWIMEGAIVGMQGGTQAVRRVWEELKAADVPISAFWLQDWVGQRKTSIGWQLWWNWEVDEQHYSGWEQLVQDLRADGISTLTYLNPFLASTAEKQNRSRDLFEEAKSQGFLVQRRTGSTYMIPTTSFDAAMVDLTNPGACEWLKGVIKGMVKAGVKGWMADFGEGLPMDAMLSSGEEAKVVHNKYPELWAKLNREAVEESKQSDELVFFTRAGFRESARWSTLFWEGDQMVSWQRHDGIKSAVVGLLSGGVSGLSLNHSDVGGYCTVDLPFLRYHRSQELLLRWMELNAFSTIFRTHEGNIPSVNHQVYSSRSALLHFARFAKVYQAWAFYRKQLVQEAAATGVPVVRHMFLHYPQDEQAMAITYQQFMVGSDIMVVPVLDKGREHVWAYFPSGQQWTHVWTSRIYGPFNPSSNQGCKLRVGAPLGYPAVFVKTDSRVGRTFVDNLSSLGLFERHE